MHYIRFLKKPSLVKTNNKFTEYKLEAKVTITTDLQESLLQKAIGINAIVQDASGRQILQEYRWERTSRSVDITFTIRPKDLPAGWSLPYKLGIAPADPKVNLYKLEDVARNSFKQNNTSVWGVQPVWSNEIWTGRDVGTRVERLLILPDNTPIRIWEEAGNSLTAHIWYVSHSVSSRLNLHNFLFSCHISMTFKLMIQGCRSRTFRSHIWLVPESPAPCTDSNPLTSFRCLEEA